MLKTLAFLIFWTVQASAFLVFFVPFTWGLMALWAVFALHVWPKVM